jgi:nucleoside-diphosphate-sugar epimerase
MTRRSAFRFRQRALVAGAAGFIGSHLCERLLAEGFDVVGLDNFLTGRFENIAHLESDPHFDFTECDIVDDFPPAGRFDWIFHFASPASPPAYQRHSTRCLLVNSEGTLNLLQLAVDRGACFLLASTSEVYGDPLCHPQPEAYWGNVNPIGPRSMYDEGKRFAECSTVDYHRTHGLRTRIIRIFNTYGPRMDPDDGRVVSNFLCQALRGDALTVHGDGSQTRSFQYVDDLVEGVIGMMRVDFTQPVNLGNPEECSILELISVIRELVPRPLEVAFHPRPVDDPTQRKPDISLARRLLGWSPRVPLRDGLQRTMAYFARELVRPGPSDGDGRSSAAHPSHGAGRR